MEIYSINFHEFVDNHEYYVLVVRLTNNKLIAGYSEEPLIKGQANRGMGFISSLTNM